MAIKAVIFDVDGTLGDSFSVFVSSFTSVLKRNPLQPDEIQMLRGMSVKQLMKHLKIRFWQLPKIVRHGRAEVTRNYGDVILFPGIADAIKQLHADGITLFIASTNSVEAVHGLLRRNQLDSYLTDVQGDIKLGGKAKRIKLLCQKYNLTPSECMYVGDEVRDVVAARKAGVQMASVAWGFNTIAALKIARPDVILQTPNDLATITYQESS